MHAANLLIDYYDRLSRLDRGLRRRPRTVRSDIGFSPGYHLPALDADVERFCRWPPPAGNRSASTASTG
ncbi:hypothetical protein [Nonomuraea dietziae]|uniref:hypothetical protein n=1 Tax=Nonomuraea dietziae TaxID=65515 RepID=UPI0031DD2511